MKKVTHCIWTLCMLALCTTVQAQLGGPPPSAQQPKAQQLPLSGRQQNGSVVSTQTPTTGPGGTTSVNTINPSIQVQGTYQGSVPTGTVSPETLALSLQDAVKRGVQFNLGAISVGEASQQARAQRLAALAQLLPDLTGSLRETVQQENLPAEGLRIRIPIPGFKFPSVVTFNNIDLRASLSESLSVTAIRNWRASQQNAISTRALVQDSRELVTLAVCGSYLQLIATAARIETGTA